MRHNLEDKVKLFQYGSNMSSKRLNSPERLCGKAEFIGIAKLDHYRLVFDLYSECNGCAVSDIVPDPSDQVWGVLCHVSRDLVIAPPEQRSKMDEIEGAKPDCTGNYHRIEIEVQLDTGRTVRSYTYVGTKEGRHRYQEKPPNRQATTQEYVSHILTGAKEHCLPEPYIDQIRQIAIAHNERLGGSTDFSPRDC